QTYTVPVIHRRSVTEICNIITDSCKNIRFPLDTPSLKMSEAIAASREKAPIIKLELQRLQSYLNNTLNTCNEIQEIK
ncbi:hypothetical protein Bpfe_012920, partial [Biomphalaria pfeifferi]